MRPELVSPGAATTGLLVLAAGASSRLGQPKQLLVYEGQTLLRRAALTALASGCGPVVIVTGAEHDALLPELAGLPVLVVRNSEWEQGMGSSIRTGLETLERQPEAARLTGVVVMLCDQPMATPELIRQIIDNQIFTHKAIVASFYAGACGVPALFHQTLFPELRRLAGAAGARQLIGAHPERVATVPFPGGALDVDTRTQYEELLRLSGAEDGFL